MSQSRVSPKNLSRAHPWLLPNTRVVLGRDVRRDVVIRYDRAVSVCLQSCVGQSGQSSGGLLLSVSVPGVGGAGRTRHRSGMPTSRQCRLPGLPAVCPSAGPAGLGRVSVSGRAGGAGGGRTVRPADGWALLHGPAAGVRHHAGAAQRHGGQQDHHTAGE